MKMVVQIALVVSIPALLFMNVWQSYRYWQVEREIQELERVQVELFQKNKLAVAGIAYLHSPSTIDDIADNSLGLEKPESRQVIHVRIERSDNSR